MYDVVAIGELLIDFIQNGVSGQGNPLFEANPGGAPCDVLAMLEKQGYRTAFIGKVGNDFFGRMLKSTIEGLGIQAQGLVFDDTVPTTLALVHNKEDGDREFSFYRNPGADMMLKREEILGNLIEDCRIFHFGSLSMTAEPITVATLSALDIARRNHKIISFDPNLRLPLWNNEQEAQKAIWYGIEHCDVLKIADNEIRWLTGQEDFDKGIEKIRGRASVKLINVTLGREGSISYYKDKKIYAEPFLNDKTIDTTGAGDTFCACVLGTVLEHGLEELSEQQLMDMLARANAAASIVTTRKGALCSMPEMEAVKKVMRMRT